MASPDILLPDILVVAQKLGLPLNPIQGGRQHETPCWACASRGRSPDTKKHGHLTINAAKQVFRCPRCGYSGNVYTMARDLLGKERGDEFIKDMTISIPYRRIKTSNPIKEKPALDVKTRNAVYNELLRYLILAPRDKDSLLGRGFSEEMISEKRYKSMPSKDSAIGITSLLLKEGYPLEGIPGFYKNSEGQWTFMSMPGFIIPVRNENLEIQGFQIRVDQSFLDYLKTKNSSTRKYMWMSSVGKDGGVTSGAPVHIANPQNLNLKKESVGITEGPLKADLAAYYTGMPFIGIAGTGMYRQAAETTFRLGVKKPLIFYDADKKTNPHVQENQLSLIEELALQGIMTQAFTWDENLGKGIDDLLISISKGVFPIEKEILQSVLKIEKEDVEITVTKNIKVTVNPRIKMRR